MDNAPVEVRPRTASGAPSPARYRLEAFDDKTPVDRGADLARLHASLLSHSPVALLGPDFMERFYYRQLPRLGLIFGQVAYVDDRPAGFIVATDDASGFMQSALRRRFRAVATVMLRSILRDPKRIGAIWEALQIMRSLPPTSPADATGELLSFGVLPEFRSRGFTTRTKLRISQDLLAAAVDQIRKRGIATIRVIVDTDNLEARLFYLGNGWRPGRDDVPGWRKKTVEFVLSTH